MLSFSPAFLTWCLFAYMYSSLFLLPKVQSQCNSDDDDSDISYCNDDLWSVQPRILAPTRRFQITTQFPLMEVALFNTSYGLCALNTDNFMNGYKCTVLEPRGSCNTRLCISIVECNDPNSTMTLEDGPVLLTVSILEETDEDKRDTEICYASTPVNWTQQGSYVIFN